MKQLIKLKKFVIKLDRLIKYRKILIMLDNYSINILYKDLWKCFKNIHKTIQFVVNKYNTHLFLYCISIIKLIWNQYFNLEDILMKNIVLTNNKFSGELSLVYIRVLYMVI